MKASESVWPWAVVLLLILLGIAMAAGPFLGQAALARRRAKLLREPFPRTWEKWLREKWRAYRIMPEEVRQAIRQRTAVLFAEKRFEACGDLEEVTEPMRVLILAQAALLLLVPGSRGFFPSLRSILVYPVAFRDRVRRRFGRSEPDEEIDRGILLGESWSTGSLILSWDDVNRGAAGEADGVNVVLHEFAHQLDQGDGSSDGAPELETMEDYDRWTRIFQRRFEEMTARVARGREPLLDEYGATDPAEFFAVATEAFFETPRRLKREMRDLYEELRRFYAVDPAAWER